MQLLKNVPKFYRTRRFIAVFTRALHWLSILSQSDPVHTNSSNLSKIYFNTVHPHTSWSSYWSLSFWLSHQYPIRIPCLPHSCYMPCPSHPPWLDQPNYVWQGVQVMKLLIMQFPPSPITSSLLGPNILLSILFSNTRSLGSFLNVRDHVSYPYRITGKIIVLYIGPSEPAQAKTGTTKRTFPKRDSKSRSQVL
jgi:hypothetical protein